MNQIRLEMSKGSQASLLVDYYEQINKCSNIYTLWRNLPVIISNVLVAAARSIRTAAEGRSKISMLQ